jgi:hypothetical protein
MPPGAIPPPGAYPGGYPAPPGAHPGGYPGQPGGYPGQYPPARVPKKSRVGLWVGLGIGAVVLLCVCCVGGLGVPVYFGITEAEKQDKAASVEVLTQYLNELVDREYDTAYDLLCTASQVSVDLDEFVTQANEQPLQSFDVGEPVARDTAATTGYDIDVDQVFLDGQRRSDTYFVDMWDAEGERVCLPGD